MPLTRQQIEEYRRKYAIQTSPITEEEAPEGLASKVWGSLTSPSSPNSKFGEKLGAITLDTIKGGFDQTIQGLDEAQKARNPLQLIEGTTKAGAGIIGTLFAPLSPIFHPIGKAIEAVADKIGSNQNVQDFANSELGQLTSRIVEDINNLNTMAGGVAGTKVPSRLPTRTTAPKAGVEPPGGGGGGGGFFKDNFGNLKDETGNLIDKSKVTLFGEKAKPGNIDEVIKMADSNSPPAEIRTVSEAITAKPSLTEKWAGISPDIKNRISGKQEKLKEYFDVAHARNNFDTLPTPLEYGAKNVETAVTKMEGVLNDKGSQIGQFREKVSTYQAPIEKLTKIENSFTKELDGLNLEVKKGVIQQKPGTVKRVNSEAEIKALNELYGDWQIVKQGKNLERLIDLRNLFDSKINFAKSTRDVSSALDPLSRNVRKQIASTAAEIVGKSEAAKLKQYSDFIDAYNELKSYSDRKAGSEFLLKQVLSERARTPREVMSAIKEFTGIDLMDDAVMASIATDLIGNSRQKGVFRQEITKAGLDASAVLKGNPSGAIDLMFNFLQKNLVNKEKQFLKAAK